MNFFVIFASFLVLTSAAPQYLSGAPVNPLSIDIRTAGAPPAPGVLSAPVAPAAQSPAVLNAPAVAAHAFAVAGPNAPAVAGTETKKVATIVKDERTAGDDGSYSISVETSDGTVFSESGSPSKTGKGSFIQQGSVSFTHPGGEKFDLKYVADENGFQPESANLPVAPTFPHPIPQFVLDQIAFAAEEDKKSAEAAQNAPPVGGAAASPVAAQAASPAFPNSALAVAPAPSPYYNFPSPAVASVVPPAVAPAPPPSYSAPAPVVAPIAAPAVAPINPPPPSSVYGFPG